jgi:hypothetical protein
VEALYLNWLGERLLDRPTGVTTDDPRCLSDALTERLVDYLWNLHVTNAPALTFVVEAEVEETAATARRGTYGCCPPDPRYSNTGTALLTDPVVVHMSVRDARASHPAGDHGRFRLRKLAVFDLRRIPCVPSDPSLSCLAARFSLSDLPGFLDCPDGGALLAISKEYDEWCYPWADCQKR